MILVERKIFSGIDIRYMESKQKAENGVFYYATNCKYDGHYLVHGNLKMFAHFNKLLQQKTACILDQIL